MNRIVGIDIGGTQTRCAIASEDDPRQIIYKTSAPSPQDGPDAVLDLVAKLIREGLEKNDTLSAMGCVAPGMANIQTGTILRAANLKGWNKVPLKAGLSERIQAPVVIENDVNAAAIAEAEYCVTSTNSPIIYLTISTGIAAGIIVNGELVRGANYSAGEVGGMVPSPDLLGRLWQPGGCTERHSSGSGLANQWVKIHGGKQDSSRAIEVFNAADHGDEKAIALVNRASDYIAQLAIGLACVLDPEIMIIGGSIGQARPTIIEHIKQELANAVVYPPPVKISTLGSDAPLLGSLTLAHFLARDLVAPSSLEGL
ncbi:MAG: ROK family protein [Bacteroidetes bacterium]|nr:ROK family protein [Bacteroidota bacterium]MCY4233645.1 ROK family protein [Bacteroidota bacterium]